MGPASFRRAGRIRTGSGTCRLSRRRSRNPSSAGRGRSDNRVTVDPGPISLQYADNDSISPEPSNGETIVTRRSDATSVAAIPPASKLSALAWSEPKGRRQVKRACSGPKIHRLAIFCQNAEERAARFTGDKCLTPPNVLERRRDRYGLVPTNDRRRNSKGNVDAG